MANIKGMNNTRWEEFDYGQINRAVVSAVSVEE